MSYRDKLCHNYHELTAEERRRYHREDRFKFTPADRFFFEGNIASPGQMYLAERRALYYTIMQHCPAHCLEIGTHRGGGSTFFLASAFARLDAGPVSVCARPGVGLVTLEKVVLEYNIAKEVYSRFLPGLLPYVTFLLGDTPELFRPFIEDNDGVAECVFLDGSGDPKETVEQYEFFKPFFKHGSLLMLHDWGDNERDLKMSLLEPIITADPQWALIQELGPPESVGFVVWRRR